MILVKVEDIEVRPEQDWKYLVGRAITPTPTPHQK